MFIYSNHLVIIMVRVHIQDIRDGKVLLTEPERDGILILDVVELLSLLFKEEVLIGGSGIIGKQMIHYHMLFTEGESKGINAQIIKDDNTKRMIIPKTNPTYFILELCTIQGRFFQQSYVSALITSGPLRGNSISFDETNFLEVLRHNGVTDFTISDKKIKEFETRHSFSTSKQ
jgi:hypothetical protein